MSAINTTELLAATSETLVSAGYAQGDSESVSRWAGENSRLLEDAYCVVGVRVYPSWQELADNWPEAQSQLIEIMSSHLLKTEAKLWDGYLVLITPGVLTKKDKRIVESIRYDTHRLRKLVISGDDLETVSDVKRALLPLLPLEPEEAPKTVASSLERLPDMISDPELPKSAIVAVVDAFLAQEPIIDRLHDARSKSQ